MHPAGRVAYKDEFDQMVKLLLSSLFCHDLLTQNQRQWGDT
jgi:hypothetical protein